MSGPAGLVVTWSYAKRRWQEKSFPICPYLDRPLCSVQKGIIPSNSVVSGKMICWTAPKHRAWPTDELTTQGVKQMILCFLPRKKKFNSGIQMGPLWKLKSKMVIEWVTTTLEWQNHEIQGEMVFWYPNTQPEMDLSQPICMRPSFVLVFKQKQNLGYMFPFGKSPQHHRRSCLILNLLLENKVRKNHCTDFQLNAKRTPRTKQSCVQHLKHSKNKH